MTASQSSAVTVGARLGDVKLRAYRRLRRGAASYFNLSPKSGTTAEFSNVQIAAEIVVYFADDVSRLYQIEQWMPILEMLNQRHKVLIICRSQPAFHAVRRLTSMSVLFLRQLRELNSVMYSNDFKVALYVNNSALNFHPLMFPTLLHVHLNHGESDKISMASNQAKAYDQVFVAGQAAIDRYMRNLINFNGANLVQVGRPQLDVDYPHTVDRSPRPTILYAPTWEGDRDEMNYTSLDHYGVQIVRQLLAAGTYRLVYKPHPRVADLGSSTQQAHSAIVATIKKATTTEPEVRHVVEMDASILSVIQDCDAMVSDVSSVALDFLYKATDKPLFLTDRHDNREALLHSAPLAAGSYVIDSSTVDTFPAILAGALAEDSKRDERRRIRDYYFGDLQPGQSTERFLEAVEDAIALRDDAVSRRDDTEHAAAPPALGMASAG
ncbi:MAG: CDP-glycerol--glycerophosphate glycerophosphotransferase [Nitriliruptorales bacterium]|nr:CDP-glycerol--glycerophosphate glycerophosphotransferase [Nitriliruptorales bacterium]